MVNRSKLRVLIILLCPLLLRCGAGGGSSSSDLVSSNLSCGSSVIFEEVKNTDSLEDLDWENPQGETENFIITFANSASQLDIPNLLGQSLLDLHPALGMATVTLASGHPLLASLLLDSRVLAIENDQQVHATQSLGSLFGQDPNTSPAGSQPVPLGISQIRANNVWNIHRVKGEGIKVAILDTGIDNTHEDLSVAGGANFSDSSSNINAWQDVHSHGTHVAGIACALDNDVGVVGVAPECELYAVKVLNDYGSGSDSQVLSGINWAIANKMDVINLSLGRTGTSSVAYERVLSLARDNNIVVVASSGNNAHTSNEVLYPAKSKLTVAVGAVNELDQREFFSSYGHLVDISAPGGVIRSTTPNGLYGVKSGTSMAAPHISGAFALMKQLNPSKSIEDLKESMFCSSVDVMRPGKDMETGYGRVDALDAVTHNGLCSDTIQQAIDANLDAFSVTKLNGSDYFIKLTFSDQNDDISDGDNGTPEENIVTKLIATNTSTGQKLGSIELTSNQNGQSSTNVRGAGCGNVKLELVSFTKNNKILEVGGIKEQVLR